MRRAAQFFLVAAFVIAPLSLAQNQNQATSNTDASHGVSVEIPALAMIKIVNGNNAKTSGTAQLDFNLLNNQNYLANNFSGTFTSSSNGFTNTGFAGIKVIANGAWTVTVSTTTATAVAPDGSNISQAVNGSSFTVNTSTATPGAHVTLANTTGFTLPDLNGTAVTVASGTRTSAGWESLGFGGDNYELHLTGAEPAGTYNLTIDYTISTP